jgi:hypothetical protein
MTDSAECDEVKKERQIATVPLTRIYIDSQGDIVVTDLWESVRRLLKMEPDTK